MSNPLKKLTAAANQRVLSDKLKTLLIMGVQQCGSYDPDEVFPYIEEQLTQTEYVVAACFLTWICQNKLTFGHANIDKRFKEFKSR